MNIITYNYLNLKVEFNKDNYGDLRRKFNLKIY